MKKALLFSFSLLALTGLTAQSLICTEFWKNGAPVTGSTITVTVNTNGASPTTLTETNVSCTTFIPANFPAGSTLSFTAAKDGDDLNGVTVLDLVAMSSHILGIYPLNYPAGYLAADINRSNSITTFDIVESRKLIMGIYQEYPNNTSWRFIPGNCYFPNTIDPFVTICYPIPLDLLQDSMLITGVKVGDVDGDAISNGPQIIDSAIINIPDLQLVAGVPTTIEVQLGGAIDLSGIQAEFLYDASTLQFNNAETTLHFAPYDYAVTPGKIKTVVADPLHPMVPGEVLMKLNFTSNTTVQLSDVFSLNSSIQHSLGAAGNAPPVAVKLSTLMDVSTSVSHIDPAQLSARVQPNPFAEQTTFTLQLDAPENVRLEIFNLSGQRLYVSDNHLSEGSQTLKLPLAAMAPGTVGYYRLQAGEKWTSGKLIRL